MGLDPAWKRALHARAPGAFLPARAVEAAAERPDLVAEDGNIALFSKPDDVDSGERLAAWFRDRAADAFYGMRARAYALTFDDAERPVPQKAATQAKRAARGPAPFDGAGWPGEGGPGGALPAAPWPSVLANRAVRARIVGALAERLAGTLRPPPGRGAILDHRDVVRIDADGAREAGPSAFAEGDLKLAERVEELAAASPEPPRVVVLSIDSDMIPVLVGVAARVPLAALYLQTRVASYMAGHEGESRAYIDVLAIARSLAPAPAPSIATAMALCGCDFAERAPGVTPRIALAALEGGGGPDEVVARALGAARPRGGARASAPAADPVAAALWTGTLYWQLAVRS